MIDNNVLPQSTDTKEILAAIDTWFLNLGQVQVVASDFPVNHKQGRPYPEKVSVITMLEVSKISVDQARKIHGSIGSEKRSDVWGKGRLDYQWLHSSGPIVYLIKSADEDTYTTIFPLLYYSTSDVDPILSHAFDAIHMQIYQELGLGEENMLLYTLEYSEEAGWQPRADKI